MLKHIPLLAFLLVSFLTLTCQAQDKIIRKDGSTLQVRILTTDDTFIRYRRFDNLTGPVYYIYQNQVERFEYEKKDPEPTPIQPQTTVVIPTPLPTIVAKPELVALEQQLARYKRKSTLNTLLGAGGIVTGIVTFVVVNGAYSTYKSQLEGTNTTFSNWYQQNYGYAPGAGNLAQPKGLFSFGPLGVSVATAALIGGGILTLVGRKNASLARQTSRELEQKRNQLSIAPLFNSSTQTAGLQLSLRF